MANLSLNEIKTILKAELEKYVLESNEDMLKINPYSKKEVEEEIEFTKTLKNLYRLGLESGDDGFVDIPPFHPRAQITPGFYVG